MRAYAVTMASFFLAACTASKIVSMPIQYQLVDHPSDGRIELIFRNESNSSMCISADYWPNAAGKLNQMGGRVFLVVDSQRFSIENFNTGYCIGNTCAKQVDPGEQISGSIPYQDFALPDRLWNEPKTLDIFPQAYLCP